MGNGLRREYEDEQEIWTPAENPSVLNNRRQKAIFDTTAGGYISFLVEGKNGAANLLNIEVYKEIEKFHNMVLGS